MKSSMEQSNSRGRIEPVVLGVALVVFVGGCVIAALLFLGYGSSLLQPLKMKSVELTYLRARFGAWEREGRPTGAELERFMTGRATNIVVSNFVASINGKSMETLFALVGSKGRSSRTLLITTNGEILLLGNKGTLERID